MEKRILEIKDYDKEQYSDDTDTLLINNMDILDKISQDYLTVQEIKELQLFVNPISSEVFRYYPEENSFKVDNRYEYQSY